MKKYIFISVFLFLLVIPVKAQIMGIGGQWSKYPGDNKFQFNANISVPFDTNESSSWEYAFTSGIDYLSGDTPISGLNIKPVNFILLPKKPFRDKLFGVGMGTDAGYNFNFKNHDKDGIILTPYLYADIMFIYLKIGYDFNTFEGEGQFFVRIGLGLGWGVTKLFTMKM